MVAPGIIPSVIRERRAADNAAPGWAADLASTLGLAPVAQCAVDEAGARDTAASTAAAWRLPSVREPSASAEATGHPQPQPARPAAAAAAAESVAELYRDSSSSMWRARTVLSARPAASPGSSACSESTLPPMPRPVLAAVNRQATAAALPAPRRAAPWARPLSDAVTTAWQPGI